MSLLKVRLADLAGPQLVMFSRMGSATKPMANQLSVIERSNLSPNLQGNLAHKNTHPPGTLP